MHTHTHIHTRTHTRMHTHTCMRTHTHCHTHTLSHMHTHARTHAHTVGNRLSISQDEKIMVSLNVFVVSSSLFSVFGFLCGYFYRKRRIPPSETTQGPPLEVRKSHNKKLKQHKQEELELETNVAYGSLQPRVCKYRYLGDVLTCKFNLVMIRLWISL